MVSIARQLRMDEEAEWGTWMFVVPFVCFNIVEFHQVDRVKCQFNEEQSVPGAPVNVDRYDDWKA
ncbi:hypothetical protein AHAS_Ahas07G0041300 [Arachis hypogaea]